MDRLLTISSGMLIIRRIRALVVWLWLLTDLIMRLRLRVVRGRIMINLLL